MMLSYICLGTNNISHSTQFYDQVLGVLGINRCEDEDEPEEDVGESLWDDWAGWQVLDSQGEKNLLLWLCKPFNGQAATHGNGTMLAFKASTWAQVDAFHAVALANGGSCEGAPGIRPHVSPDFYAAYVRDPDGNKLAAICLGLTAPTA